MNMASYNYVVETILFQILVFFLNFLMIPLMYPLTVRY